MEFADRSSSKIVSEDNDDLDVVVKNQPYLGSVEIPRYPLRGLKSVKLESCSPGEILGSINKTLLNTESSSLTSSVDDVVRPRRRGKFASNKSFNRVCFYAKKPLDFRSAIWVLFFP